MNREFIQNVAFGVIGSLIASGIIYITTQEWLWNIVVPIWVWLIISLCIITFYYLCIYIRKQCYIKKVLSEYRESCFGDSYPYIWDYKKGYGEYSFWGYEPHNIRIKDSVKESLSKPNTFVYGHIVPEDSIKRIIQLTVIYMVEKKKRKIIEPTLKYFHYVEDSQMHKLLH